MDLKEKIEMLEKELKELKEQLNKENMFRAKQSGFCIDLLGTIKFQNYPFEESTINALYKVGNFCTDREILEQRALHETLNRLIWRWQKVNDSTPEFNEGKELYLISFNHRVNEFVINYNHQWLGLESTYFTTDEKAEQCVKEVVKPFLAEHKDFKMSY